MAENSKFYEHISQTLQRAKKHGSPEFLANEVLNFPYFSDILEVTVRVGKNGATVPKPVSGSCKRVPVLLAEIDYLILLQDERIVSIEPILDNSDYWLEFIRALDRHHYWPVYREE